MSNPSTYRHRLIRFLEALNIDMNEHHCIQVHIEGWTKTRCPNIISPANLDSAADKKLTELAREWQKNHAGWSFWMDPLALCLLCDSHKDQAHKIGWQWHKRMSQSHSAKMLHDIDLVIDRLIKSVTPERYPGDGRWPEFNYFSENTTIRQTLDHDCCICCRPVEGLPFDELTWCAGKCGANFHILCIGTWIDEQVAKKEELSCPCWYVES